MHTERGLSGWNRSWRLLSPHRFHSTSRESLLQYLLHLSSLSGWIHAGCFRLRDSSHSHRLSGILLFHSRSIYPSRHLSDQQVSLCCPQQRKIEHFRYPKLRNLKFLRFLHEDGVLSRPATVDIIYTAALLAFYFFFTFFQVSGMVDKAITIILGPEDGWFPMHYVRSHLVLTSSLVFNLLLPQISSLLSTIILTLFQSYRIIGTFARNSRFRFFLGFANNLAFVLPVSLGQRQ